MLKRHLSMLSLRIRFYFTQEYSSWLIEWGMAGLHLGCAVFAPFFIRFIFTCFGIFANTISSHHSLHTRSKIFAHIRIQIFDLMQKNTCCSEYSLQNEYSLKIFLYWRIFASKYSFRSEYSRNFKRISHSSKFSLINIRMQQIFACKYSHTSECSLRTCIASNYLEKSFTSLSPHLVFGSFWKGIFVSVLFVSHVKSADSLLCETSE